MLDQSITNNSLRLFENNQFGQLRVVNKDGEPWFVAVDVCRALGLDQVSRAVNRLDDDEKDTLTLSKGIPGNPNKTVVSESGLYSLVLGSRKPEARTFKRWVTHEVIPSIRKTGGYIATKEDDTPESIMARAVLVADETIKRQKAKLEAQKEYIDELKPKALFADAVTASHTSILVGELAKMLRQNGVNVGQNRLFGILRDKGYLMKQGSSKNMPTQRAMELGLFEIKETSITHSDGHVTISKTPKVTGKGQQYFIDMFLNGKIEVA